MKKQNTLLGNFFLNLLNEFQQPLSSRGGGLNGTAIKNITFFAVSQYGGEKSEIKMTKSCSKTILL